MASCLWRVKRSGRVRGAAAILGPAFVASVAYVDPGNFATNFAAGAKFPAGLHMGHAQCWSWDFDPDDGWIYLVSTGFQRNKGVILQRVRPQQLAQPDRYVGWDPGTRRWGGRIRISAAFGAWRCRRRPCLG